MGYAIVTGTCFGCQEFFGYNPHKVPSIRVNGERQAICRDCVGIVQGNQRRSGTAVTEIHPQAYEPIHESEL
jgi:hypothetical protein